MFENLNFGKTGFKTCVLKKHFISYSCILFLIFNALRSFFKNQFIFFKNSIFLEFHLIQYFFRSIKISFKILSEPLSVSINRNWFLINQKAWIRFFKKLSLTCSNSLFKSFSNFSFSLRLGKGSSSIFCRFPLIFLQGFPLSKPVSPFYPSFCILFHVFMHFFGYKVGDLVLRKVMGVARDLTQGKLGPN